MRSNNIVNNIAHRPQAKCNKRNAASDCAAVNANAGSRSANYALTLIAGAAEIGRERLAMCDDCVCLVLTKAGPYFGKAQPGSKPAVPRLIRI